MKYSVNFEKILFAKSFALQNSYKIIIKYKVISIKNTKVFT